MNNGSRASDLVVAVLAAVALLASGELRAAGQQIVVPNSLASVEGNVQNAAPFNLGLSFFHQTQTRYQQVYDSSQFSAITGSALLTQIAFRPDFNPFDTHHFNTTLPGVRIDFSTISAGADGLSSTFANNVGADDTIVFGGSSGGPLTISTSQTGGSPRDFDILINLTTPFEYNPSAGNLLLDVRLFDDGLLATAQFDAQNTSGDSVSRVHSIADDVTATTGLADTTGLVTRFTFEPVPAASVPEPGFASLLGIGLSAGLLARRRVRAG